MTGADMQTENKGEMGEVLNTSEVQFKAPAGSKQQSDQIDLRAYYQTEVDHFAAEQLGREDDYTALKKKVAGQVQAHPLPESEQRPRAFSLQDRIRHKTLLVEARIRGVGDLQGFQRLIEYFETTLTEEQQVYRSKKGKDFSDQEKEALIQKWTAKGYHASMSDFKGLDNHFWVSFGKDVPLNIRREHIPVLKDLLALNSDPVKVIRTMRQAGMYFSDFDINPFYLDPKFSPRLDKLKKLLGAPHLQEVMSIIKGIPNWDREWFTGKDKPEPIDSIINLAETPNPQEMFSPDVLEKIEVLSQAMERKVLASELQKYRALISNPEQFNFLVAFLNSFDRPPHFPDGYETEYEIFDNLAALQGASLLGPLTALCKSGIVINKEIFTTKKFGTRQAEVVQRLQEVISTPHMQAFLQDSEKQKFVGLLSKLTGRRISTSGIEEALNYFDKRQEVAYLYNLIYDRQEDRDELLKDPFSSYQEKIPLGVVSSILKDPKISEIFMSEEFNSFLSSLRAQEGYEPTPTDFYKYNYTYDSYRHLMIAGSALVEVFGLRDIITSLGKDSPSTVLETLRGESASRGKVEYYEFLARSPQNFQILKEYNLLPPDDASGLPKLSRLIQISDMPLVQRVVLDRIPISDRRQWIQNVITLPDFVQRAILAQIEQAQGDISNLFVDGEPTHQLARHFLEVRDFITLHAVLTDDALKGFEETVRNSLAFWKDFPEDIRDMIIQNVPGFPNVSVEKLAQFRKTAEVMDAIKSSPSKEIRRLQHELIQQLWQTENPQSYLKQILDVFEKNNLPLVGKIYRVFEILHSPEKFEEKIRSHSNLSPVLVNADIQEKYSIVYRDLLKISIDSGSPSLRGFLKALQEGQQIIGEIEQHGVAVLEGPENVGKREAAIRFMNRLDTLYANSNYGRRRSEESIGNTDIQVRILELKANLGIKGGKSLLRRVSAMFLRPLGYSSIEEVLARMESIKAGANNRNIQFAHNVLQNHGGNITLQPGDLLKGIKLQFLDSILLNGSLAKEYLGASANSDSTPFDADTSRILPQDTNEGFGGITAKSVASNYGNFILVIRDRGQFQYSDQFKNPTYVKDKYELFSSKVAGDRHYGIRTGIASTEIDVMIARDSLANNKQELERLYFTLAQNGFYTPVVDENGRILFSPELFEEYKIKNEEVREILNTGSFRPEELIDTLKKSPFIKHLYESPVGVWEGYNLDEHTRMVMSQYEKYFADRWRSPLVSQQGFRMMLVLHDLGKPLAVQITGSPANQHEYTMKFLPKIIEGLGLRPQEVEVMVSVVNQDNLGQYLQQRIDAQTAARNIRALAEDSGVPVNQLFELIKMYFMCDAGAYTEDAGGRVSLDNLFFFDQPENGLGGQMKFSAPVQGKIDELNKLLLGAD